MLIWFVVKKKFIKLPGFSPGKFKIFLKYKDIQQIKFRKQN